MPSTDLTDRHRELRWVANVQRALEDDRLALDCQPIFAAGESGRQRLELLLRLYDPEGNTVGPSAFLPALEHYNLAVQLDRWVVASALEWLQRQPLQRLDLVAINLSTSSLEDNAFIAFLQRRFASSPQLAPKVCFEIKEASTLARPDSCIRFIRTLRERGCRFAMDDVGSGWGSFNYLRQIPVGLLKISGALVNNMLHDPVDYSIVKSISEIGHAMGKRVVASWVENEAVYSALSDIGVDYAQGNFLATPQPLAELRLN